MPKGGKEGKLKKRRQIKVGWLVDGRARKKQEKERAYGGFQN